MNVFVDTSALYALLDADDKNHERAKRAWLEWIYQPIRFISSNYILLESLALIQRRLGMEAVRGFQKGSSPSFKYTGLHLNSIQQLLAPFCLLTLGA